MGWFSRKTETPSVDELLEMNDRDLKKVIESGNVPQKTPKELRRAAKAAKRAADGEKGLGALVAGAKGGGAQNHRNIPLKDRVHPAVGAKGGGAKNYQNIPLKDRVHPSEYRRILDREAKKQGLL